LQREARKAQAWGTDLEPLPIAALDEITSAFKTASPEVETGILEIPVGESPSE